MSQELLIIACWANKVMGNAGISRSDGPVRQCDGMGYSQRGSEHISGFAIKESIR